MGNIQTGDKSQKRKSPSKSKNFLINLNRKSPGRDSGKKARKKSDTKRDVIEKDNAESDNFEVIESADSDAIVFKRLGESAVTGPSRSATRVEAEGNTVKAPSPARSADSVFTDALLDALTPPLTVEINQSYFSAESNSLETSESHSPTPEGTPLTMPQSDILEKQSNDSTAKSHQQDVVMGALSSKVGKLERSVQQDYASDFRENRLKACPGATSFTISKHRKVELQPALVEPSLLEKGKPSW